MQTIKKNLPGIAVCLSIAIPSWLLGKLVPVIGGPVFSILLGMIIALLWTPGTVCKPGIGFTSKKILQAAVVLLGFGLNLNVVLQTGKQSLPIIICTITTSLLVAFVMHIFFGLSIFFLILVRQDARDGLHINALCRGMCFINQNSKFLIFQIAKKVIIQYVVELMHFNYPRQHTFQ